MEIAAAYRWMTEGDRQNAAACLDLATQLATDQGSFGLVDRVARERLNLFSPVSRD